jgi:hypothetical protein
MSQPRKAWLASVRSGGSWMWPCHSCRAWAVTVSRGGYGGGYAMARFLSSGAGMKEPPSRWVGLAAGGRVSGYQRPTVTGSPPAVRVTVRTPRRTSAVASAGQAAQAARSRSASAGRIPAVGVPEVVRVMRRAATRRVPAGVVTVSPVVVKVRVAGCPAGPSAARRSAVATRTWMIGGTGAAAIVGLPVPFLVPVDRVTPPAGRRGVRRGPVAPVGRDRSVCGLSVQMVMATSWWRRPSRWTWPAACSR